MSKDYDFNVSVEDIELLTKNDEKYQTHNNPTIRGMNSFERVINGHKTYRNGYLTVDGYTQEETMKSKKL